MLITLVVLICTFLPVQMDHCRGVNTAQAAFTQHRKKRKERRHKMEKRTPAQGGEEGAFVPSGSWGGEHVSLEVGQTEARVEFDCAHGTLPARIKLSGRNEFDVEGIYIREHGGPERPNVRPDTHTARYAGRVDGEKMIMSVTLTDVKQSIGTFTLIRGRSPVLFKCL